MMDTSMLAFLAAPFVASLILTGIHAYLGVHVVERGVIFVDLSLAQIAALGATIAILTPMSGGDPVIDVLTTYRADEVAVRLHCLCAAVRRCARRIVINLFGHSV